MPPTDIQRILDKLEDTGKSIARIQATLTHMPTTAKVGEMFKTHTAECRIARRASVPPPKPWYQSKVGQGLGALLLAAACALTGYFAR